MKIRNALDGRVHFSELKRMADSPLHYKYACEHPMGPSRAMTVGTIADRLVFRGNVAVYPGKVRNGKEWEAFRAANQGAAICIQSEYEEAAGAAEAVLADQVAGPMLRHDANEFQRVMQWTAYELEFAAGIAGEHGRGGFDVLNQAERWVGDLKITADASPEWLARHVFKMWWHVQAASYLDGAKALALDVADFYLFCVEASPPHPVTVLKLSPEALDLGRKSLSLWTSALRACEEADAWPGYVQSVVDLAPPEWMSEDEA